MWQQAQGPMNKGSIVERFCSDLIAKSRDINGLLYMAYFDSEQNEVDGMKKGGDMMTLACPYRWQYLSIHTEQRMLLTVAASLTYQAAAQKTWVFFGFAKIP